MKGRKRAANARPTRDRILDAAADLMHAHGYAGTTLAAVQKAAGVHGGSLAYFFPTKEDLLAGVLERYRERLHPVIMGPALASVEDPIERIFAVLAQYRKLLVASKFTVGCPIGTLALETGSHGGPVRDGIIAAFGAWQEAIRGCVQDARPLLRATVDPAEVASFVLTVMEGAVLLARGHGRIAPFDRAVRQLRLHIDGLRRPTGHQGAR